MTVGIWWYCRIDVFAWVPLTMQLHESHACTLLTERERNNEVEQQMEYPSKWRQIAPEFYQPSGWRITLYSNGDIRRRIRWVRWCKMNRRQCPSLRWCTWNLWLRCFVPCGDLCAYDSDSSLLPVVDITRRVVVWDSITNPTFKAKHDSRMLFQRNSGIEIFWPCIRLYKTFKTTTILWIKKQLSWLLRRLCPKKNIKAHTYPLPSGRRWE